MRLESVSLAVNSGRLNWFEHIECEGDAEWFKYCTMMEVDGSREWKTRLDGVMEDTKSFGLCGEDAQVTCRMMFKGQYGEPSSLSGRIIIKTVYVIVCAWLLLNC